MSDYRLEDVRQAFQIYTLLARDGYAGKEELQFYHTNGAVRGLIEHFARDVDCNVIQTAEKLYLIPRSSGGPFQVSNDWLKRNYLRSDAVNADIYLVYFATIVLFGAFFDRYNSQEQTLQFITYSEWVRKLDERVRLLESHDAERLIQLEQEFSYNWRAIIAKWNDMDAIRESAKRQTGNTISRLSFIDTVKRFLVAEDLVQEIGNDEITLTEKAKVVIQRYFMDTEYNNNILEFIYEGEGDVGDAND